MRLNYHHLQYFWAVAKEGHLTRAATQLHVSQSALSTQIRQLEQQLGHSLFVREGRRLTLTETGRVVLGYAENIFGLGAELIGVMAAGHGPQTQTLRVGSVATLSRNFQENFLRPVLSLADVQLVLESGSTHDLLERLSVHKLDLVLSNRPVSSDATRPWRCRRIARQPICVVGPPRKTRRRFRFPDDLRGQALLLPGRMSEIRTAFDLLCEELDLAVNVLAEVDDMAMLRLLARDSGRLALVPPLVVQDELRTRQLQEYCVVPGLHETFYAITMQRRFHPPALRELLRHGMTDAGASDPP
jgi:LysR family transcriptional regulator, transcriptional activator of nhaA